MNPDLVPRLHPTPLLRATGVLATSLGKIVVWFVPIVITVPVILYALVALLGGELDGSSVALGVSHNAPMWFLFAMGASLLTQHLPVAVAHGLTRRTLAAALTWTLVVAAALLALVVPLTVAIESLTFDALDWTGNADERETLLGALPWITTAAFVRVAAMASIGVLAAITYYRFGTWWGSLVALATVGAPGFTILYVLGAEGAWIAPGARLAIAIATAVVVTAAHQALIRGTMIRGKPA